MNYFLMLVILLMGGGGFYEYNILNSRHEGDEQRLTDMSAQVETFKTENTKLTGANAELVKTIGDTGTKLSDLAAQLQAAQTELAQEKQKNTAANPSVAASTNALPTPGTNNLGTIATVDGKVYANSLLMKVQAECIVVSYPGGITQVPLNMMQPDLQKRFGFDPKTALMLSADQVAVLEQRRKAAGATAGN